MDWDAILEQFRTFWAEWGWLIEWLFWAVGACVTLFTVTRLVRSLLGQQKPLRKDRIGALPKAKPDALNVLIFEVEGDDRQRTVSGQIAEAVREAFGAHANVEPARFFVALPRGKFNADRERAAWALVQDALARTRFSAAVWGRLAPDGRTIFPVVQALDQPAPERAARGHDLLSGLGVPIDAIAGVGPLVAARVSAETAPAYEGGRYVADILQPVADRLQRLLSPPPAWMDADMKGRAWHDLGVTLYRIGEQAGSSQRLLAAIAAYREALQERTRERVPLDWATTQTNLGNALWALGQREAGTARLQEAVTAYREALKEWTRERVPLQWAATQNNLGNALAILGEREGGNKRLEGAVAAYRDALREWTRERVPLDWAMTQNNLGNALWNLGQREAGTARLQEAVAAYREALQERTRERVPLDWAMTQNNLGNALWTLGQREAGTTQLEEAVTAFREALKEWTRERVPLQWAMTQNNLGNAIEALGDKAEGEAAQTHWRAAESAFLSALEVFRPAGASHYIQMAEGNLDRVRAKLRGG